LTESGYVDLLASGKAEEPNSSEKKTKQEEQKEAADESEVTAQAKENDGGNDDSVDDDNVNGDQSTSNNEKKQKPPKGDKQDQHERESPTNDIQKAITENCTGLICGGGLALLLVIALAICYGCYRCCCAPKTAPLPSYTEVELSDGYKDGGGSRSYKDDFVDEQDDNDEQDAEYGVSNASN
jgi:DNA mismatch repair ATPase MutL